MADKKTKAGKLLKKGASALKNKIKKELNPKSLKKKAVDYVAGDIKDRFTDASRSKDQGRKTTRIGGSRKLAPTVSAGGTFELKGNRKKRKQKKKIAKWEKQKKTNAAAGNAAQSAFLALDKKNKGK